MNNYVYDDDYAPLLPKGTILKITAWHDNTAGQQEQPRSRQQWVGWGDRTVDEMAHAWINITYMSDDDFQQGSRRRARRRCRPPPTASAREPAVADRSRLILWGAAVAPLFF